MKRTLLAGFAGGIVVFIWGALAHTVLPLGGTGIRMMPNEEPVIATMRDVLPEPGLYFFPGLSPEQRKDPAAQAAWAERMAAGPRGILVYHPTGAPAMSPGQLVTELGMNLLAALIAAWLLSQTALPFARRVIFVAFLGFFGWLTISVPYWNWYGFPADFTMAEALDQVAAWTLAGLAIGRIVPGRAGSGAGAG